MSWLIVATGPMPWMERIARILPRRSPAAVRGDQQTGQLSRREPFHDTGIRVRDQQAFGKASPANPADRSRSRWRIGPEAAWSVRGGRTYQLVNRRLVAPFEANGVSPLARRLGRLSQSCSSRNSARGSPGSDAGRWNRPAKRSRICGGHRHLARPLHPNARLHRRGLGSRGPGDRPGGSRWSVSAPRPAQTRRSSQAGRTGSRPRAAAPDFGASGASCGRAPRRSRRSPASSAARAA